MVLLVPFERPVLKGRLVRRYKRFFVDVVLDEDFTPSGRPHCAAGSTVVAHTANTGAMTGLVHEGAPVLLTWHDGTKRKLPFELEAVDVDGAWSCVNTGAANAFAAAAVHRGLVPALGAFVQLRREVAPSSDSRSRFDLCLERADGTRCFVEVKSVTLRDAADPARVLFPDAVTERGRKHLDELAQLVRSGTPAAMLYVSQRHGAVRMAPAAAIDPAYARALRSALGSGVAAYAIACRTDVQGLWFAGSVAVELGT